MARHGTAETFGNKNMMTRLLPEASSSNCDSGRLSLREELTSLYGEETYKKINVLGLLSVKQSRNLSRLAFLKRCRDHDVIPNCVRLKHHKNTKKINKILHNAELAILRDQIAETRLELHKLRSDIVKIEEEIKNKLNTQDWEKIHRITEQKATNVYKIVTETHKRKFDRLNQTKTNTSLQLDPQKVIVNLTDKTLDEPSTSLLLKGLNYAIAPKHIPTEEIISYVESTIRDLPAVQAEQIRQDVAVILRKAKPPKSNLTREELKALKLLKEDESIVILPADKGNATVLMKTENYKEKMYKMLEDGPYNKIKNPTRKIAAEVKKLVISSETIDSDTKKKLIVADPLPPLLYGLPKIHKENIPMRPIVSSIGSPVYNLAKHISNLLADSVGKTDSFVKDSRHFIDIIKQIQLEKTDLLVSFDVESLFTKVPIPETLEIIKKKLNEEMAEMAALCLQSTYFRFDGHFYEQTEGAAMGSPLSPVAANLYMEDFEIRAIKTATLRPKIWLRYVDDVWAVWPHGRETIDNFLNHLNSVHPNIKFTIEIEKDKKLPFLDVLTSRNSDGTIGHAVYRKPTHTNRYLHAKSHHHPAQKNGILNTLVNRAIHISDQENWGREKRMLQKTLQQNGYCISQINRALTKQLNKSQNVDVNLNEQTTNHVKTTVLPYIQGTSERIGKILKKHNIRTVYKPPNKLRNFLRPVKDKIPLGTPGVYEIPCSCGSAYIGETKRLISTRIKEHIRYVKNKQTDKSAVAEHDQKTHHAILFDEAKVLAKTQYYYPRIIRESIEIAKRKNNFNRDDSYKLPTTWNPVLSKLGSR